MKFHFTALCPDYPNFAIIDGSCYFFNTNGRYRVTAKENCQSLNGTLWEPKTLDEIEKVKSKAFEIVQNGKWWWIGISDASIEGVWQYDSNGENFLIDPWTGTEPNGGTIENCAIIASYPTYSNTFIDVSCSDKNWYSICQLQSASQSISSSPSIYFNLLAFFIVVIDI